MDSGPIIFQIHLPVGVCLDGRELVNVEAVVDLAQHVLSLDESHAKLGL